MLGYKYSVLSQKITKLRMAYRDTAKITTTEILEELTKRDGNNRDLFYLYVSTSGIEVLENMDGQQRLITDFFLRTQDSNTDDTTDGDTMDDENEDGSTSQLSASVQPSLSRAPSKREPGNK